MENNELKQVIRNYILENKEKMYEAPEDDQEDQEGEETNGNSPGDQLTKAIDAKVPELDQKLAAIVSPNDKIKVLDKFVDYLLGVMGTGNLPQSNLRNWALSKFSSTNEEKVDEMSTTAGVPAPPAKYAFKLKKKKD